MNIAVNATAFVLFVALCAFALVAWLDVRRAR